MKTSLLRLLGAAFVLAVVVVSIAPANATTPPGRYTYTSTSVTVYDTKTKLTWQRTPAATGYTWADAKAYCGSPTLSASLGGTGWRLPTLKELQSIVDYSKTSGLRFDEAAFSDGVNAVFWSATQAAGAPTAAWVVLFLSGGTLTGPLDATASARCVR
jgi:hypothetical protein